MLKEILEYNGRFVREKQYEQYQTSKYPDRKIAILTCMDTRLTHLLPAALGLKNGEVKLIKNAGGIIFSPWDSTVRSLLIAILELGVEEVLVIGHTDCGVCGMKPETIRKHLQERGIGPEILSQMEERAPLLLDHWFTGFRNETQAVCDTVMLLQNHPLMPSDVAIYGFIMDSKTGELRALDDTLSAACSM